MQGLAFALNFVLLSVHKKPCNLFQYFLLFVKIGCHTIEVLLVFDLVGV